MKILSCGAGMQSTALALMACENAREPGKFPCVPIYDLVCFCNLGKEPPCIVTAKILTAQRLAGKRNRNHTRNRRKRK